MKIISYNVNGIRAAIKKGFIEWLKNEEPDVVCLQEVKADREQVDLSEIEALGYETYWHSAQKKGYSGVATFTKVSPVNAEIGCGQDLYDCEGRVLRLDFENFSLLNVYMPSGSSGDSRQAFKMEWLSYFQSYVDKLKLSMPDLVICGDVNICHTEIDIHNPKSNAKSSGFLPEEREWVGCFLSSGFTDAFRLINKEPHNYTWWSYRANARNKNLGWRIDYFLVADHIKNRVKSAAILPEVKHSDHCPILLEI